MIIYFMFMGFYEDEFNPHGLIILINFV